MHLHLRADQAAGHSRRERGQRKGQRRRPRFALLFDDASANDRRILQRRQIAEPSGRELVRSRMGDEPTRAGTGRLGLALGAVR